MYIQYETTMDEKVYVNVKSIDYIGHGNVQSKNLKQPTKSLVIALGGGARVIPIKGKYDEEVKRLEDTINKGCK